MARYNGDAQEYKRQVQEENQARLAKIYQDAVNTCQQADQSIDAIVDEFAGLHTSNLDEQQAFDRQFAEHMIGLGQRQEEMQSATDAVYSEMQACLDELNKPAHVETDVERLNRLYRGY